MKGKIISIIATVLVLSGCAQIKQMRYNQIKAKCNPAAAYNAGLTDGLTPDRMPKKNYAADCPSDRDFLNMEYLRGFHDGLVGRPQKIKVQKK